MAVYRNSASSVKQAHTISEFIALGNKTTSNTYYRDLSYIENRDNMEFIVKNTLADFIKELKDMAYEVELSDLEVLDYRYNPKKLANDIYGTTSVYYVILLLNDMCDVHRFNLKNKKLLLLTKTDMANSLSSIYKSDQFSLSTFNNAHKNDIIIKPIRKYR